MRDLLGVQVDGTLILPPDEQAHGFDTNADALSVVPALLDRYLTAAAKISRLAVGDPTLRPAFERYTAVRNNSNERTWLWQTDRLGEEFPLGSRGGIAARHYFPVDGEYVLKARLDKTYTGMVRGLNVPNDIEFRVDGKRVGQFTLGGPELSAAAARATSPDYADAGNPLFTADDKLEVRVPLKAGLHEVTVTAVKTDASKPEGLGPDRIPIWGHDYDGDIRAPLVFSVLLIGGPYNGQVPQESLSRRRIFVCSPTNTREETPCATKILSTLAQRAYRRPATKEDVQTLVEFYKTGRAEGTFEAGIRSAIERLLVSPDFLFRIEADPAGVKPGAAYRIPDVELASRLSFFLWSSIPDDELLDLAIRGKLRDAKVFDPQVRRMLADPRARTALVQNFFSQWLQIRNVWLLTPDASRKYPWFDDNLRTAFVKETELFLESQLQDDRSMVELLTANYTYLNEQLARHYGIQRCLRQPLPPRAAGRSESLGTARQGQHPVGDVVSAPHLADDSRQVAARKYSGGAGAASASGCEHRAGRGEDGQSRHRCARCSSSTARIRRARAATPTWIRSVSASRISIRSASGARKTATRRSTRPACCSMARRSTALRRFAARCCSRRISS